METKKLDILFDKNLNPINVRAFNFLAQYGANYELRVGFTDPTFDVQKVSVSINNGIVLPEQELVYTPLAYIEYEGQIYDRVYCYQLTFFDTSKYSPSIDLTFTVTDANGVIYKYTRAVQMQKALQVKLTNINI